mmetsp:Transcript_55201/g.81068  ORF Transcript_55201/g.81068 Transcript_55201/m.81068 type:complete len:231 (-) Transcript_55201:166-858(-)
MCLLDLVQCLTCRLHLEIVLVVGSALEDSALGVELAALALARRHHYIHSVGLVGLESALLHGVPGHVFVGDDLGTVSGETLDLVGHHAIHRLAAVCVDTLLKKGRDLRVLLAGLKHADDDIASGLAGHDSISSTSGHRSRANNHGGGHKRNVAIHVHAQIDLANVTLLEIDRVLLEGREVAAAVVERNAGGESNTLLYLFTLVHRGKLLVDELVARLAQLGNALASLNLT